LSTNKLDNKQNFSLVFPIKTTTIELNDLIYNSVRLDFGLDNELIIYSHTSATAAALGDDTGKLLANPHVIRPHWTGLLPFKRKGIEKYRNISKRK